MKMEILQLSESIDFLSKSLERSIDNDIYTASVSHGTGGTFSGAGQDKLPRIAEKVGEIRKGYSENIYAMQRKKNIFERTVSSIDIFANSLDWSDKTILFRRFFDNNTKSAEEMSAEVHLTVSAIKKRTRGLILQYAKAVHFDIAAIIEELE